MTTTAVPQTRKLNGPQTTGRNYRNLSQPEFEMTCDKDVAVAMRDGTKLLVDVYRPKAVGQFPALLAASLYPRQIQNLGAPMGFIEAGASDFWVARGYVHVIANLRGTSGSEGTFTLYDSQERRDMHDLVEWVAEQTWCDGEVGGVGLSYFASTQLEAAAEQPPHLKAIFPLGVSPDLYEEARHNGLYSHSMVTPFMANVGIMSDEGKDHFWRGKTVSFLRHVLSIPAIHGKLATFNGESAKAVLAAMQHLDYDTHPWDDLWRSMAVEHPFRDEWWDDRNTEKLLEKVNIPVYLGCDWENVPLHLPGTFRALDALKNNPNVRVALLGRYGLTWPWESMHEEALAWFDHWLKGRDTGIMDGPKVRYWLPVAEEWRTADTWPPPEAQLQSLALRADGGLGSGEGEADGARAYEVLPPGLAQRPTGTEGPSMLTWDTEPLQQDLDVAGNFELLLDASATASDAAWIVSILDVDPSGAAEQMTAGWLQASLREVDEAQSSPGSPYLPCRRAEAIQPGERVSYRIPLVANARRFKAGHSIRLLLCGDDQPKEVPAIMGFRHQPLGLPSRNTVFSTSRLLLPVLSGKLSS